MKTFFKTLIILLLISFAFFSCKKEEYKLSKFFKEYLTFPSGAMWIFKDSIHGIIDTISLTNANYGTEDYNVYDYRDFKNVDYVSHSYYSSLYKDDFYFTADIINPDNIGIYKGVRWVLFDFTQKTTNYRGYRYRGRLASMLVDGVVYNNVDVIDHPHFPNKPKFYWIKGCGLVQYQNDTNYVWKLQKRNF